MGFMGYSTEKLKAKAAKRGMTLEQYCDYLEYKKRTKGWAKKVKETNS